MDAEGKLKDAVSQEPVGFTVFLEETLERGGCETDDGLAAVLPLMRQCLQVHEAGKVAPLDRSKVFGGTLWFEAADVLEPKNAGSRVRRLLKDSHSKAVDVKARYGVKVDITSGTEEVDYPILLDRDAEVTRPSFFLGYTSWEQAVGHHDALTDIFILGLLLGSFACHVNLKNKEDLERFIDARENLRALNPRLHPVVADVIDSMTVLDRRKRAQDLASLISVLENYRNQPHSESLHAFWKEDGPNQLSERRKVICEQLQHRLFDVSRRNRLIYFRTTNSSVNLTLGSVPLLLDYKNIKEEQLLTWQDRLHGEVRKSGRLSLAEYLRFEDAPYLGHYLDTVRRAAQKDVKEYGFDQLRLIICFLRWHNLKDSPDERIHSPLLLLPVGLVKKKGIRDDYVVSFRSSVAEVNPALRHMLEKVYGLKLPESIDLEVTSVQEFYEELKQAIQRSEPAVKLEMVDKPKLEIVHKQAKKRLESFRKKRRRHLSGKRQYSNIDYSYSEKDYNPLGVQLFHRYIRAREAPFQDMVKDAPKVRTPFFAPDEDEAGTKVPATGESSVSKEFYSLKEGNEGNNYRWDFDLCSLTLSNLNYRNMTLVRDYVELRDSDIPSESFDRLFSFEARDREAPSAHQELTEQYTVVPADPSQQESIAQAVSGANLIIQGPPGTGKSQTITNLMANFVAQGKRILFVCEKRAAIDVVFNRLSQCGLGEISTLIHDSQADKKAFIQDLESTYEALQAPCLLEQITKQREMLVSRINEQYGKLESWSESQSDISNGASPLQLLEVLIGAASEISSLPKLSASQRSLLPNYEDWLQHEASFVELADALEENGFDRCFGKTAFALLNDGWVQFPDALARLLEQLRAGVEAIDAFDNTLLEDDLDNLEVGFVDWLTLAKLHCDTADLRQNDQLGLLNSEDPLSAVLKEKLQQLELSNEVLQEAETEANNWSSRLSSEDASAALNQARKFEGSFLRWVQPAFWRLRGALNRSYDFDKHEIRPSYVSILEKLNEVYAKKEGEGS